MKDWLKKTLIVAIPLIVLGLIFVFTLTKRNIPQLKNTQQDPSSQTLVDCTSTISNQPIEIPGYKVTLFASDLDMNSVVDTGTRTFSLEALKKRTGGDDIYYQIEKKDGSYITGLRATMEICDENNKTSQSNSTKYTKNEPADNTATILTQYMHGGYYPHSTGKYRIDAYANIDGDWKLVGRLTDIVINK
jgi:hypothetical protein